MPSGRTAARSCPSLPTANRCCMPGDHMVRRTCLSKQGAAESVTREPSPTLAMSVTEPPAIAEFLAGGAHDACGSGLASGRVPAEQGAAQQISVWFVADVSQTRLMSCPPVADGQALRLPLRRLATEKVAQSRTHF